MTFAKTTILFATWCISILGLANEEPRETNLREQCRKFVAGAYLTVYDQVEHNAQLSSHLRAKIVKLEKSLPTTEKELKTLQAKLARETFDLDLATERDAVQEKHKLIAENIVQSKAELEKAQKLYHSGRQEKEALQMALRKVFVIKKETHPGAVGYHLSVDFRVTCPKFQYLCMLPKDQAEILKDIMPDGSTPQSCKRYANFVE